jgi:putative ABC transport system permease protein
VSRAPVSWKKGWPRRWWRRLRTLVRRDVVERELDEELALHLELETEKLRRGGLSEAEARRRARLAFGGVESAKENVRDARWLPWAPGLGLDLRLGARMLAKAPGLALVGGLGIAVGVAISSGVYAVYHSYFFSDLPLHEGDRVVSLVNFDSHRGGNNKQLLHDFGVWRRELRSVVDLGAFRTIQRNLIADTGAVEPITLAEMSAAGFRLARVAPLLGRTLAAQDERGGGAPVLVIGETVWRTRFDSDPAVLGRAMRLSGVEHTIVGVMPEGFAFPVNHQYWVPLRADPDAATPESGPALQVFGRLAPGATAEEAQAELAIVGKRLAAARAGTPAEHFEPRVVPYTDIFTQASAENESESMQVARLIIVLLLVVIAMNVGVLVYARTMSRGSEIAVRTALGATRRRIVAQLFAETLVLSTAAALIGLGMTAVGLRWLDRFLAQNGGAPFWIDAGLSAGTILHALWLAVLASLVAGLFPALRATREQLRSAMGSAGAGSQARLGRTWTALIVVQVTAAVAILPPAMLRSVELATQAMRPASFPAEDFLAAKVKVEPEDDATPAPDPSQAEAARAVEAGATWNRLLARLAEEPDVAGATVASDLPWGGGQRTVEVEVGGALENDVAYTAEIGTDWFELFGVRVLAGRSFIAADVATPPGVARPVIVNRSFADELLGGGPAPGQRVRYRYDEEPRPWFEIVGVVEDFPAGLRIPGLPTARMYHPAVAGEPSIQSLSIRLRGTPPADFAPKLREIAAAVDPMMQLSGVSPLDATFTEETRIFGRVAMGIVIAVASVLLLSAAGIHALVAFTVNNRRREIGIRAALGANRRRILVGVLARAARQLGVGATVGLLVAVLVDRASGGLVMSGRALVLIPATAAFALVIGVFAAAGPARRALRVEPTEAIRAE